MLTLLLGTDWKANRDAILYRIAADVKAEKKNRILIVPELISHDMERRLCACAGDTTSRFAEVISFTRLARRISEYTGVPQIPCLDNGGRIVAMASAARQIHSRLKAYAAVETRPEFLTGLIDAVDEFKRCCITAADLKNASLQTEGNFAQKLEELGLLLEAYDSVCAQGRRDPRDQMSWLLDQLEDSDFAQQHTFYFNGFPDYSRQNMAIVNHILEHSQNVTISLTCDCAGSEKMAFEKAGETAAALQKYAKKQNITVSIEKVLPVQNKISSVCDAVLQGTIGNNDPNSNIRLYHCETVYDECALAAEYIIDLILKGNRYRDIRVVSTDMAAYQHSLNMIFSRAGIPVYQSGTEDILDKTVIHTVLAAIDAALSGFEQKSVIRYLKSMLAPVSQEMCDRIENYAIVWSVEGRQWTTQWENHPGGISAEWTEKSRAALKKLNEARVSVIEPLVLLRKRFQNAQHMGEQIQALYQFLEQIDLSQRLQQLADKMDQEGDNRSAQILNQLWEILINALEQLYDMLGATIWDTETFIRLLKLLLSQYDVGTIPSVLDAVSFGPISAMRCQQSKHLIILGASEGNFPNYGGSSGVLSDSERSMLQKLGIPLNSGAIDGLQTQFAEIYDIFHGSDETIQVSCSGGQPSFIFERLKTMVGNCEFGSTGLGAALTDRKEAGAYLVRMGTPADAAYLGLTTDFTQIKEASEHTMGMISLENIKNLYGEKLHLSASQIDRLAECRLSYFMKYGIRAQERKAAQIDPAEFGTYVHAVLEECGKKIVQMGGFKAVSLEQTLQLAADASARYFAEHFQQISSDRISYQFNRNSQEVMLVVEELWKEMQETQFQAKDFEVAFGPQGQMDAITFSGTALDAELGGFVDRVDTWKQGEQNYFRIVDYKTGAKDFDYCDVFNGIGLQMLLYLFALEDSGDELLGANPLPAGVQYFPARVPLISANGLLTDEEAENERQRSWRRKGLLLKDEMVLMAMEPTDKPVRLPYTTRKDGSMTGDLASSTQFKQLRKYIFHLLSKMVDDIASGNVQPNPYTRGSSHNACAFCPYGAVCRPNEVEGRRDFQAMKADKFWEEVEKEVNRHG